MQALMSLLPESYSLQVAQIWNMLEEQFGLTYIKITPIPHFTWQLGEGYCEQEVLPLLHELTVRQEPFEVRTNGLNHFPGTAPVLFIEVQKTAKLTQLHTTLWNELLPLTSEPSPLYSVESWHPHITLALEDLGWDRLEEVTIYLQKIPTRWHFRLDNLTIACQTANGNAQVEHIFRFGKGLTESFSCCAPAM